ncbi:hypothetical protein HanXRQr2_Chr09g0361781 [Helianthus annuus]|uniref:Retrovirus-related Pol polyprotein from transposon TNT 1-94-like beta-barrel domain-containing protein n=1 Tax=Helianthus annuus TaxID=4232 RepID=A0A9K3I249_HELAN|nr:hypothetical protein HanXRQr2_Chr09g0361781 [Helianthus annuus]
MANLADKGEGDDDWVVDSGATEHITFDLDFLENKIETNIEAPVIIPNGTKVPVKGRGLNGALWGRYTHYTTFAIMPPC